MAPRAASPTEIETELDRPMPTRLPRLRLHTLMIVVAVVAVHLAAFSPLFRDGPRPDPPTLIDPSQLSPRARGLVALGVIAAEVFLSGLVWVLRWEHLRAKRLYGKSDGPGGG